MSGIFRALSVVPLLGACAGSPVPTETTPRSTTIVPLVTEPRCWFGPDESGQFTEVVDEADGIAVFLPGTEGWEVDCDDDGRTRLRARHTDPEASLLVRTVAATARDATAAQVVAWYCDAVAEQERSMGWQTTEAHAPPVATHDVAVFSSEGPQDGRTMYLAHGVSVRFAPSGEAVLAHLIVEGRSADPSLELIPAISVETLTVQP